MNINQLAPAKGARKRNKRVGCGVGSGHGRTSTRGGKGQTARTGSGDHGSRGFEGGQMPLMRRMPKRGFSNSGRREFVPVNLGAISEAFEGHVTVQALRERGLAKGRLPIKVLGDGEPKKGLTVEAHAFSKSAKEKLEKSGGKAVVAKA